MDINVESRKNNEKSTGKVLNYILNDLLQNGANGTVYVEIMRTDIKIYCLYNNLR